MSKFSKGRFVVDVKSTENRREDPVFTDDIEKVRIAATIFTLKKAVEIRINDTDADELLFLARNGKVEVDHL